MKYELGSVEIRKRNRMPHWDAQHAIYFLTFTLFDAIPSSVAEALAAEAEAQREHIRTVRGFVTARENVAINQWLAAKIGNTLDDCHGSCFMREGAVARIVANALTHFDTRRYELLCWCVMPNHVHIVLTPLEPVDRILHSWKSFTSKRCNSVLRRSGSFWRDDYHDRCVRDSAELSRTIDYVLNNPAGAGLNHWPFVASYPERIATHVYPDPLTTSSAPSSPSTLQPSRKSAKARAPSCGPASLRGTGRSGFP